MRGTDIKKDKEGVLRKITKEIIEPMNGAVAKSALALDDPISFKVKIKRMRLTP